ncbi:HD-GYP domain-containing protein, partial [bacterium]|nr:HD-GYP domain-containing protein [bacterium]
ALEWIWEVNTKGQYTYASPVVEKILGYTAEEILGKYYYELFPAGESEEQIAKAQEFFSNKLPFKEFINKNQHKNGNLVWISTNGVPIYDNRGKFIGYRGADTDVTDRIRNEKKLKETLEKLKNSIENTIKVIAKIVETKDPYTAGHQNRVADLASAIAREMKLSPERIRCIRMAGLVHDIGKIFVPNEILSKPCSLTEFEIGMIKAHPKTSYDILKSIEFPWNLAKIALQHHERLDGSGYPAGLRGEEILLEARILGVADVVEAIAFHRPYRPALGIDKALEEIIENKGILYDSAAVDACVRLFKKKNFEFT